MRIEQYCQQAQQSGNPSSVSSHLTTPEMFTNSAHAVGRRIATSLVVAVVFAACGGEGPQIPTAFAPGGGSTTQVTGTVATAATIPPQVQILDAKGRGIKGLRVRWRVGAASGSVVNDSTVTDATGIALSGGWTLGTAAGLQTLTATADGVSPITFSAQVGPGPAANLVRVSPDGQFATVNTNVASPPSARAQDVFGNVVSGLPVTFSVASGGGSIEGAQQTTDGNGIATATSWRLGTGAGQQIARATSPNVSQAAFSATGVAGPAADMVKVGGDNQSGVVGLAVSIPPGVRVLDAFNNSVGNVPVTFTPGANSGSVTGSTVTTDPGTGTAFVGSWRLGSAPTQTLIATSSSIPGRSLTFTATATNSLFSLEVRFVGNGGTEQVRNAFTTAAVKWQRMIVGRVHTVNLNRPAGGCGATWMPAISETITDVLIFARIDSIDGPGRILAQAGPCIINTTNNLTITGLMEFDIADLSSMLNNGTFNDVVLHEMGHVLGIGTLWNFGRTLLTGAGTANPFFTGAAARAGFAAINTVTFSGSPVPVEGTPAPAGTRDGHWRESVFIRELMQGYAKVGGMPLSRVTVGSLQDMGYLVDIGAADPYVITSPILAGFPETAVAPAQLLTDDILAGPMIGVDANGRVTTVVPRRRP